MMERVEGQTGRWRKKRRGKDDGVEGQAGRWKEWRKGLMERVDEESGNVCKGRLEWSDVEGVRGNGL